MKCPCAKECQRRTATCKVDGSCPDFEAYEKERMRSYAERTKQGEKQYAANPYFDASHQRSIRALDRRKLKNMRNKRTRK